MQKLKSGLVAALALALALLPTAVAAGVEVDFIDPQKYTDLGDYGSSPDPLPIFARHLQQLGARCLAPEDRLHIRVLDIDLAGQQEWWRGTAYTDVRVMRDITWPRMQLEYDWLDGNGALRKQAQARLADMNYLMFGHHITARNELYGYDKAMLSRWFEQEFCRRS
ncbi:DUF3016 domain-containing protein [Marinobacterium rhizophilum]|uniref:DUF3016 domain-containing protein n=1 Tax=Marinobacterium rhizophilum TaxID=420402 RepID=UPI0003770A9E|nr:DUF3016 domain-containing protein [Marinobacterium rhizophilum]